MNRPVLLRPTSFLLSLAFIGFVSLGLPDAVIGVAWPSVRETFGLRQGAVGLVLVASGIGYLLSSVFAGRLMHTLGIGLVLAASTGLVAVAMSGFAFSTMWGAFVVCAWVHGLGSGAIDSGLNGYAANHMSARYLIWMHACYCFGALIGPVLMSTVLASGRHYSLGYSIVAGTMLAMSIVFLITHQSWGEVSSTAKKIPLSVGAGSALRYSAVWLQMAIFFLYTGLEVTFSQWAFTVLTESREVSPGTAGLAVGVYWGSLGTGRVVFGLIADRVGIDRLLRYCLLVAGSGALLFSLRLPVEAAFLGLSLAGFGLAPVFPCLMSRTPRRLGTGLSAHAIGFQVGAAMIGAAVVPGTLGIMAGRGGVEAVPIGTVFLFGILLLLHERLVRLPDVTADPK
ncbi:MAG: MFS transporter [Planctomycetales bacterium]|jgi:fucose permease|nr:MFS transporter [Planctomycetales bacterium]